MKYIKGRNRKYSGTNKNITYKWARMKRRSYDQGNPSLTAVNL